VYLVGKYVNHHKIFKTMSEQQLEPVLFTKEIEGVKKLNKKLFYSPTFEFQKHITPVSNQRIIFSNTMLGLPIL